VGDKEVEEGGGGGWGGGGKAIFFEFTKYMNKNIRSHIWVVG